MLLTNNKKHIETEHIMLVGDALIKIKAATKYLRAMLDNKLTSSNYICILRAADKAEIVTAALSRVMANVSDLNQLCCTELNFRLEQYGSKSTGGKGSCF